MKIGAIIGAVVVAAAIGFGIYMVDIDQTQETVMPEIEIEGGQLPEFNADVGEISVTEETVTVTVPQVNITPPEEENVASN